MFVLPSRWLRVLVAGCFCGTLGCAPGVSVAPPPEATVTETSRQESVEPKIEEVPDSLKQRIELAVEHVRRRDLRTNHAFWTVFHGILAFGHGLTLLDERSETRVNAVDYILAGDYSLGQIRGMAFTPTKYGLDVQMGPTFVGQGHQDQWVAIMAQWDVPADRKVIVYQHEYTVMDFVTQVQANARIGQELSWTIIVLGKYLGTELEWTNSAGEQLTYDDLVRSELEATIDQAACGGTHRLIGLTWAFNQHMVNGGKKTELWQRVEDLILKYQGLAKEYQNPDGSFSTNYFVKEGADPDPQQRMGSTGHQFEWLASSLTVEQLKEEWMRDAAHSLSMMFLEIQSAPMESGALYHAAHGLVIYYERVYGWEHFEKRKQALLSASLEDSKN